MPDSMSEQPTHVLQPDVLLPSQYLAAARRKSSQGPALRLLAAILQDAVECFQKHLFARTRKHQALFRDAEDWICSTDRLWPFSFDNVCDVLGIEPDCLRRGLLAWKEQQLAHRRVAANLNPDPPRPPRHSPFKAGCRRRSLR